MIAQTKTKRDAATSASPIDLPPTMRAIVQHEYGSPDVLHLTSAGVPTVGDRDVLVRVHAAGVDRATVHLMTGRPYAARLAFGLRTPRTPVPGLDVAGTIVRVGAGVTRFAVGDRVVGIARGAFADYTLADEDKLAVLPNHISFETGAAIPDSGLTAWRAVVDVARVSPGQSVLIIGASGGVGSFATQIASSIGARVTGVCSTGKIEFVRSLGALRVIDYTCAGIDSEAAPYDVIIDIGGNTSLRRLRQVLQRRGTLVIVGGEGGGRWFGGTDRQLRALALSPFTTQRLTTFVMTGHHSGLERLVDSVGAGRLAPAVTRRYVLSDVPQALADLSAGRIAGKAVVVINDAVHDDVVHDDAVHDDGVHDS